MQIKYLRTMIGIVLICFLSTSCVSILDATTDEPLQIDPGKRSFGRYMDDRKLRTVTTVNLKKADPLLESANINVHSYNAVILLSGEVPTKALRELAGETARNVNKVRQVYNEIAIAPNSSFLSQANDNWIQSRIAANLLLHKDIESSKVEIIVENNTVYLMGLLSKIQAEKITDVIKKIRGVEKVVRAIEYIE